MHGVCRSSKASREEMIALCVAIENYMALDPVEEKNRCSTMVNRLIEAMNQNPLLSPYRVEHGSVGQDYPRAFAKVRAPYQPQDIVRAMRKHHVFVGTDALSEAIYISPLNLTAEECDIVCALLAHIEPGK